MKLHLPVRLFKSVLACFTAIAGLTVGSGVAWADAQDLTFSGATLTWNTAEDNKAFVDAEDAAASFAEGDNVSFTATSEVSLGEDITAGVVAIESGADVTIDLGAYTLEAEKMVLSGTLDMGGSFTVGSGDTLEIAAAGAVLDSSLVMQEKGWLHLDAAVNLNNKDLFLSGKSGLILTASGDGRVYDLVTGISALKDAAGNALVLDSSNNAIANYFDTSLPGSGFWADATLQLTEDGTLQLVRHNETVQPAITITTRQTGSVNYSYYEGVTFKDLTSSSGGAIYAEDGTVTLSGNGDVTFSGNTASSYHAYGGAIYVYSGTVTMIGNGEVTFSRNTASGTFVYGGAIYADEGTVTLSGNGEVSFSENAGGAIYVNDGTVTLSGNGEVSFSENAGRAIVAGGDGTVTLSGNGEVRFSENAGSAIYADHGTVTLSGNGEVTFSGNSASDGGAIDAYRGTVTLSGNGDVTFSGNTARFGGAIYADEVTLSGNGAVTFSGNTASSTDYLAYGGAIYAEYEGTVTLSDNEVVTFSGNTASSTSSSAGGGAIYAEYEGTVTLSGNGDVTFSGNTASGGDFTYGGAIFASSGTVTLSGNEVVTFSGNTASSTSSSACGGAIDASTVTLSGNGDVLFEKNAEVNNGSYRLRSIYTGKLNLSASEGKKIEFRDSIYASGTVNLNADGAGDIIFTGATTVDDLQAVKGSAGTAEEIQNSRISMAGNTHLYGGCLRIEDGAVYQTGGFIIDENSGATVRIKNAVLDNSVSDLTFNATTTLELIGQNTIFADCIDMQEGSSLHINAQEGVSLVSIAGDLSLQGAVSLSLSPDSEWTSENGRLLYVNGDVSGWDTSKVSLTGAGTYDVSDLSWVDGVLVLNYNADTYERYFNGSLTLTERQFGPVFYHHYETIKAENISTSGSGGAIYAREGTVTLSGNGAVTFSENSSSEHGGAIYASFSTVTLSGNGAVTFSGNSAPAYGGAIDARYGTVELSGNGAVTFSGNTASSEESSACGGAIDASTVTLSGNGDVTFSGNTASAEDGSAYGGAIDADEVTLSGNGAVTFSGNTASGTSAYGGAIDADEVTLSGNDDVTFSGNTASSTSSSAYGGAIDAYRGTVTLSGNGDVMFSGNTASSTSSSARGGAIDANEGTVELSGNGDVLFEKNAEVSYGAYRLRSIYARHLNLSASEGKKIEFRDSIYADWTVNLNEDYTDAEGVIHKQTGDIIFTGATTEADLLAVKKAHLLARDPNADVSNLSVTESEITNSRTSIVEKRTNLYGGRLRIEDGAVYQGAGLTVHKNSAATVLLKDATMTHEGQAVSFASGTTLAAAGKSALTVGSLTMADGAEWSFDVSAANATGAVLTYNGALTLSGKLSLNLTTNGTLTDGVSYQLLTGVAKPTNWAADNITVTTETSGWSVDFADLTWVGNTLWLYYDTRPDLTIATWTNESNDGLWNTSSVNWEQDEVDYAYQNGVQVVFGDEGAGTVTLVGALAPESVLVNNSVGKDYTWNADATEGGKLTGCLKLTKQGAGTLTINTDNDYTGGTEINGGSLAAGSDTAFGIGDVTLNSGTLDLNDKGITNNIIANGGTLEGATQYGGNLTVNGDLVVSDNTTANSITIQSGSVSGGSLTNTAIIYQCDAESAILITGSSSVTVENAAVSLSGNNSYTGGMVVNGGRLTAGSDTAFGTSEVTVNNATLNLNDMGVTNNIIAYGGMLDGATKYVGNLTVAGNLVVGDNTTANSIAVNTGDISGGSLINTDITYKGDSNTSVDIADESSVTVESGGVTLSGNNSYTGGTEINGGSLAAGSDTAFGTGDVTLNAGTLALNVMAITNNIIAYGGMLDGATKYVGNLTVAGNLVVGDNTTANSIAVNKGDISGGSLINTDITYKGDSNTSADIADESSVTVESGGVTLSGNNSYTGGTEINGGSLAAGSDTAFGTGDVTLNDGKLDLNGMGVGNDIIANGGTLDGATNYACALTVNGDLVVGDSTTANSITVNKGDITGGSLTNTDITYKGDNNTSADITGDSSVTVGNVDVRLSGNSSYTGGTEINGGSLAAGSDTAFGTGDVTLNDGKLDLNGMGVGNDIIAKGGILNGATQYGGNLTVNGDLVVGDNTTANRITIQTGTVSGGSLTNSDIIYQCDADFSILITGDSSVTVENGDVRLVGNNSYTGGTVVNGGRLTVNSDTAIGSGDVTVNGGTLELNVKSISNDVFFNGGVLSGGSLDGVAITAQSGTLNSAITGESSLRVISGGVGDVILTAYNEYQGGTVVSGGTLVAASESGFALGYGAVEVNGGTLRLEASETYILSTLSGTGGELNLNGKTLYTVGYDHGSYAGAVKDGTWDMSATEAIQSFTGKVENVSFVVGENGTLELQGETTLSTAVANSGTVTFGGTVTLNMEAEGDIETLYMNAAGEIAENGYAAERKTHLVVDGGSSSVADDTIWKENGVELLETVYDNGRLTSILRDLGTYYINGGSETVQDASIFGDAAISLKSGTLNLNGVTLANDIVATGGTLSGATSYGGQLTVDGAVKLNGETTAESVLLSSGTLSGGILADTQVVIDGDVALSSRLGSGVNIRVESGTSTLSGTINNSFNGSVVINGGLLEAKSSLPTGVLLGTGSVELNGDGVLKLGNNLNVSSLRGTGGGVQLNGKTLTITGSAETEYAGQIAGNTGKMVLNAGALNLFGAAQMDTMTVSESAQLNLHGNMMQVNTLTNANKVTLADGTQGAPASLQVGSGLTVRNQQGKVAELNGVSASGNTLSGGSMSHAEIYLGGGAAPVSMMSLADAATYTLEDAALVATNVMVATELAVLNNVTMDSASSLSSENSQISVGASSLSNVTLGAAASISATDNSTLSGANCLTLTPQTVSLDGNQMMLSSSQLSGLTLLDGGTLTLDLSYVDLPDAYTPGDYLVLLKLDNFNLEAAYQESLGDSVEWLDIQGGVLGGAIEQTVTISYVQDSTGIVVSMAGLNVPEPTTATLSLLALAALAARRRRK